ncbi:hypothetical protein ACFL1M_02085 [Patescibacteria group bacterium]
MKNNGSTEAQKKNSGYVAGLLLGALFGGGSLFFFGTKTGKKLKKQLQEELKEGNIDFEKVAKKTRKKLTKAIKGLNLNEDKTGSKKVLKKLKTSNKKFFKKKGKTSVKL